MQRHKEKRLASVARYLPTQRAQRGTPYCVCAQHSRLIFVCQGLELRDQRGWSPAFNSVVFNDIPCFKQLVRVGASIDGVDKEGMRYCPAALILARPHVLR